MVRSGWAFHSFSKDLKEWTVGFESGQFKDVSRSNRKEGCHFY